MIYISNPSKLPAEPVHTFSFDNEIKAEKIGTQYQSAWLYKSRFIENLIYVYVLNSEYEAKQQVKS